MLHKPLTWWIVMAVCTVLFGVLGALFLEEFTNLHKLGFVGMLLAIMLVGDVFVARGMERIAPTQVHVGPGERKHRKDLPADEGIAVADFDAAGLGRVVIRGELWRARALGDVRPARGEPVRVVDRDGLILVVASGNPADAEPSLAAGDLDEKR